MDDAVDRTLLLLYTTYSARHAGSYTAVCSQTSECTLMYASVRTENTETLNNTTIKTITCTAGNRKRKLYALNARVARHIKTGWINSHIVTGSTRVES